MARFTEEVIGGDPKDQPGWRYQHRYRQCETRERRGISHGRSVHLGQTGARNATTKRCVESGRAERQHALHGNAGTP